MISLFQADNRINVTQNRLFTINELEKSGSRAFYERDPIFITIERKSAKLVFLQIYGHTRKESCFQSKRIGGKGD